jgi:prolyl oligopeptidase
MPDESGFYYTCGPRPGTVPKGDERYYQKVYTHLLGDNPDKDKLIFGKDSPKEDRFYLTLTMDGRYLCIHATQNWNNNDLYIYDTQTDEITTVAEGLDAKFDLSSTDTRFLLKTNYKADNYKILAAPLGPLPPSIDDWQELISEDKHVIYEYSITADKILVRYMMDATSLVDIFDHKGNKQGKLPLPSFSSLNGLGCNRRLKEFFFGISNFLSPIIIHRYDPSVDDYSVYRKHDNLTLNSDDYVVKQEWVTSKDSIRFPMFIVHHKDIVLDGENPTILYGYGGFDVSLMPEFKRGIIPWYKRGGIYAVANIRGGGEYGEKWHRDGSLDKKQNTFDDFIAAAEYLIETKITNPKRLGILGASNGGLTVGAVMMQRPELFNAVVCQVPLLDMYRFHNFLIAARWVNDYGNPDKADEFEWIRKWSPYHSIKAGLEYPNILFTTANKDTRVAPFHAWKMTALLQSNKQNNVVLLRTEMEAGHGPGKPIKKIVESQAYILAFLAWKLGLSL